MIEELTFGKDDLKFVIKQNIPLDALIEGEPVEREYEIILYNTVASVSHFPRLGFYSAIRDKSLKRIAKLISEFPERNSTTKDFLEVLIGGGGGVTIGYVVGDFPGALIGTVSGGFAAKYVPRLYDFILKEYQIKYGTKKVELIKGTDLMEDSKGAISIDDKVTLYFGLCYYTQRFTTKKDKKLNKEIRERITSLIETERTAIQAQVDALFAKNNSKEINEESSYFKEFAELSDLLEAYNDFLSVFDQSQDSIRLYNKIQIDSDYRTAAKRSRIVRTGINIGNIQVKIERKCKKSKEEIKTQVRNALYNKDYFLEIALILDLREIMNEKKDDVINELGNAPERTNYSEKDFSIPFSLFDRASGIRTYGILNMDVQSSTITEGHYFNAAGKFTDKTQFHHVTFI